MADDEKDPKKVDVFDIRHLQNLLRDSAVLLAGLTLIAYLMSHVYGQEYLGALGLENGLHSFGLGNLGMLTPYEYFFFGIVSMISYRMLRGYDPVPKDSKRNLAKDAAAVGCLLAVVGGMGVRAYLEGYSIPAHNLKIATIAIVGMGYWIAAVRPQIVADRFALGLITGPETEGTAALDKPVPIAPTQDQRSLVRDLLERKVRAARVRTIIAAFAFSAFLLLPGVAASRLLRTLDERHVWKTPDPTGLVRIPVYWVADRYVYLTNDGKECRVHVVIGSTEQARRDCSDLIERLSRP